MPLDISKIEFSLMYALGNRGTGKTLFASLFAKEYSRCLPNNKIYANYPLNLSNAEFQPYMVLDYTDLDNCLIILDDIYALKNIEGFMLIIANYSRKGNMIIILTAQYYTMVNKQTRTLSEFEVQTLLDKKTGKMVIAFIDTYGKPYFQQFSNAFKIAKGYQKSKEFPNQELYNTNFKVGIPTERLIMNTMREKEWKSLDDIELNLLLYFKDSRKREKNFRILAKENGFL